MTQKTKIWDKRCLENAGQQLCLKIQWCIEEFDDINNDNSEPSNDPSPLHITSPVEFTTK